ncbi:hypothetical protein Btru_052490 [Bulinus truncatus]|nr:hypothetical protein Btru_052490 [Bulinus truncatus]
MSLGRSLLSHNKSPVNMQILQPQVFSQQVILQKPQLSDQQLGQPGGNGWLSQDTKPAVHVLPFDIVHKLVSPTVATERDPLDFICPGPHGSKRLTVHDSAQVPLSARCFIGPGPSP